MNSAVAIRHGVIVALIGGLADKLGCFARSDKLIGIAAPIDPSRAICALSLLSSSGRTARSCPRQKVQRVGPPLLLRQPVGYVATSDKEAWIVGTPSKGHATRVQPKP